MDLSWKQWNYAKGSNMYCRAGPTLSLFLGSIKLAAWRDWLGTLHLPAHILATGQPQARSSQAPHFYAVSNIITYAVNNIGNKYLNKKQKIIHLKVLAQCPAHSMCSVNVSFANCKATGFIVYKVI